MNVNSRGHNLDTRFEQLFLEIKHPPGLENPVGVPFSSDQQKNNLKIFPLSMFARGLRYGGLPVKFPSSPWPQKGAGHFSHEIFQSGRKERHTLSLLTSSFYLTLITFPACTRSATRRPAPAVSSWFRA